MLYVMRLGLKLALLLGYSAGVTVCHLNHKWTLVEQFVANVLLLFINIFTVSSAVLDEFGKEVDETRVNNIHKPMHCFSLSIFLRFVQLFLTN